MLGRKRKGRRLTVVDVTTRPTERRPWVIGPIVILRDWCEGTGYVDAWRRGFWLRMKRTERLEAQREAT